MKTNYLIGLCFAAGILSAAIAALLAMTTDEQDTWLYTDPRTTEFYEPRGAIVDGVSSPEWWDAQKAEPF